MKFEKIDIESKSKELKSHISQFETISFVTQMCYALNSSLRMNGVQLNIDSPQRQFFYLLSLFLSTEEKEGLKVFDSISGDLKYIEKLLTEIENGYRYNYLETFNDIHDEQFRKFEVSNTTYINYFVNAPLNYTEQEIDKIENIFPIYENQIIKDTGLEINDFIDFFNATEFVENYHYSKYFEEAYTKESFDLYQKVMVEKQPIDHDEFLNIFETAKKAIYNLRISKEELGFFMPSEKIEKISNFFSLKRGSVNSDYLFYTQECPMLGSPIIELPDNTLIFPVQKQLIHATYKYLFKACNKLVGQKVIERRDNWLEEKTRKIFESFFEKDIKVFSKYYVGESENEKDILILYHNTAFIIECKAHNQREPFWNIEKAFVRIKDDFKNTIQKGYNQAYEVKELFQGNETFSIKNKKGEILENIISRKYQNIFSIVVTQERLGQIQVDLGLLLDLDKNDDAYPWAVFIDDLETFLITLKRKENNYGEFITYLHNREKLHERVSCFDELDLAAFFITNKQLFINYCNKDEYLFTSSSQSFLFDDLYDIGFGFENERNLDRKIEKKKINSNKVSELLKKYSLKKKPTAIKKYEDELKLKE